MSVVRNNERIIVPVFKFLPALGRKSDRSYHFYGCRVEGKQGTIRCVKRHWEIVADNLSKAGWSWGCVSTINSNGKTIFVADAHRDDGKRFVVRADEELSAFVELKSASCGQFEKSKRR